MNKKKNWIMIQSAVFLYSIVSVCSKLAANAMKNDGVFSLGFILIIGLMFLFLAIYAVIWQTVLTKSSLSVAYIHKGIGLLWTMIWSVLLFGETIHWNNILGIGIIVFGILLVTAYDG